MDHKSDLVGGFLCLLNGLDKVLAIIHLGCNVAAWRLHEEDSGLPGRQFSGTVFVLINRSFLSLRE